MMMTCSHDGGRDAVEGRFARTGRRSAIGLGAPEPNSWHESVSTDRQMALSSDQKAPAPREPGRRIAGCRRPFTPDLSPLAAAGFLYEDVGWARPLRRVVR
jgi:hypothetical protein